MIHSHPLVVDPVTWLTCHPWQTLRPSLPHARLANRQDGLVQLEHETGKKRYGFRRLKQYLSLSNLDKSELGSLFLGDSLRLLLCFLDRGLLLL